MPGIISWHFFLDPKFEPYVLNFVKIELIASLYAYF
ncbi:hypothetical protein ABIB30_001188 [Pedobacter sp. UYP1]